MLDYIMLFGIPLFLIVFSYFCFRNYIGSNAKIEELLMRQRHIHDGLEVLIKGFVIAASEKAQSQGKEESKLAHGKEND